MVGLGNFALGSLLVVSWQKKCCFCEEKTLFLPLQCIWCTHAKNSKGKKYACATICHTGAESNFVSGTLSGKVFSLARGGELKISGFPDFAGTLSEIKQFQRAPQPTYQVCVALGDGSLIIRQSLVEFWTVKHSNFADKTKQLVETHNKEFNPKGLQRGSEEEGQNTEAENVEEPRLALSTAKTIQELQQEFSERRQRGCFV